MIKKILKYTKNLIILVIGIGSIYLVNLFFMKPYSIDHFLGKELALGLLDSPEALTYIGVFDRFNWLTKHNSRLSIPENDLENDIKELEDTIRKLYKYDDEKLSETQKITKKIAIFDFENNLKELQQFPHLDYPLNQIGGIHLNTIQFMNDMHPIRIKSEAVDFIKRADLVKKVYEGTLKDLEKQAENKIYPPEFVYGHVIKQLQEFIDYEFNDHPLYAQFMIKVNELNLSESDKNYLDSEIKRAIKESVTPGFELLLKFMLKTEKFANKNHGIWSQPGGDEYYKLRIRSYTTTDYSPEEIHQMGLSEVKRITDRMNEILTGLGYDTSSKSVGQIMNELNENPDFLYADTPDRKEIVIKDYTDMTNEAIEVMTDYFHTMPKSEVVVKAVPEYSEKTAAGGYYQSPALDGSRPGVFYANLYDIKQTPKYSMRTLTYHEATPGHHHQIAHSLENDDLTLYRRFGYGTSAFSEGWALYAERLALEVGLANDPYDELGILQSEIFRAVRLVVDTGMHYKRWTREEAMKYMKDKTGMSDTEVRVEIERYIVWPGQALSYKVGMIKILELRERAMNELGDDFNLKDFHSAVLDHGNPPLFIVEEMVNKMIENAKS